MELDGIAMMKLIVRRRRRSKQRGSEEVPHVQLFQVSVIEGSREGLGSECGVNWIRVEGNCVGFSVVNCQWIRMDKVRSYLFWRYCQVMSPWMLTK